MFYLLSIQFNDLALLSYSTPPNDRLHVRFDTTFRLGRIMADPIKPTNDAANRISYLHEHDVPMTDRLRMIEIARCERHSNIMPPEKYHELEEGFYDEHL